MWKERKESVALKWCKREKWEKQKKEKKQQPAELCKDNNSGHNNTSDGGYNRYNAKKFN